VCSGAQFGVADSGLRWLEVHGVEAGALYQRDLWAVVGPLRSGGRLVMTEEEAKTKACPMSMSMSGSPSPNVMAMACLGSGCMAWIWEPKDGDKPRGGFCGMMPQYPGFMEDDDDL
jgi:hypothetical protein